MKRVLVGFAAAALVVGITGSVGATPISLDVADGTGGSSVTVSENARRADLEGALAPDLGAQTFVLEDGESQTFDFFTLTASGFTLGADYAVEATLAFDNSDMEVTAASEGHYVSLFSYASGGTLTWENTAPNLFVMPDGTSISISFAEGSALFLGNTVTIQATVANNGGGTISDDDGGVRPTPVPEPGTLLLLGSGMVGLALSRRKKALLI